MKLYTVKGFANRYQNNGEKNNDGSYDYGQVFEAYNTENDTTRGRAIAYQYSENHHFGESFPYQFLDEYVMAETGGGALLKTWKWLAQGLSREYLTGNTY
jgi:hypothetical protein